MSTYITVDNKSRALVGRVKQVQEENREGQLQREKNQALQAKVNTKTAEKTAQLTPPTGGNPNTDVERRPAAQRLASGIFAAEVTTRYDANTDTFYVKASVPGVEGSVEVPTTDSGRGSVASTPPVDDTTLFTAYGRVYKYVNDWAIYRDQSFGGGTNYEDPFAEPPRTSNQTDYQYPVSKRVADESLSLLLPLSNKDGILIYMHNRIEIFNKYTRATNKVYSSVNERNIRVNSETQQPYQWGQSGYSADWDAQGHTQITYSLTGQETFPAYEIIAFYVSDKGVKQIDVPPLTAAVLEDIYPAVTVNGTADYFDEINFDSYYAHDFNAFVDVITSNYATTYQSEPAFSANAWQASSRYGVLDSNSFALPQHFGLGYLNTSSHAGPFFTPAVFRFLTGPMVLDNTTAQTYAAMRGNYFPNAPFRFYAPCARTSSCQDATVTEFDLTQTQPTNATTALTPNLFRRSKGTDVTIGNPEGSILYSWDWGKPAECQTQLLDLGFTPQDLTL